ncbi:hypothetical protein D3C85_1852770 [compost metagenome]
MAKNVERLLLNEKLHAQFKEACIFRARNEFCNDVITTQYEQIYYRVLGIEADLPIAVCSD